MRKIFWMWFQKYLKATIKKIIYDNTDELTYWQIVVGFFSYMLPSVRYYVAHGDTLPN